MIDFLFHVVVSQTVSNKCTGMPAARAARLFALIQPIISLICSIVVTVSAVMCVKFPNYFPEFLIRAPFRIPKTVDVFNSPQIFFVNMQKKLKDNV